MQAWLTAAGLGLALLLPGLAQAAPNQFDPTFGTAGVVQISPPSTSFARKGVAICADGTVYATHIDATNVSVVTRYGVNGAPDLAFDTAPASVYSQFSNIGCDPNGKLYVFGAAPGFPSSPVVHRFLNTGAPDLAYGVAGTASPTVSIQGTGYIGGFAIDAAGNVIMAGSSISANPAVTYVIRLTPSGTLDPTFGVGGEFSFTVTGTAYNSFSDIALDGADRILILNSEFDLQFVPSPTTQHNAVSVLTRLTPNGLIDTSYGVNGSFIDGPYPGGPFTQQGYLGIAADASGATFLRSNSCQPSQILKLNPAGTPEVSFGTGGIVTVPANTFCAQGLAVGPDGALYVAGYTGLPWPARQEASILKMSASTGAADPAYGPGGIVSLLNTPLGSNFFALAFKPNGKLMAWGSAKWVVSVTTVPTYPLLVQLTDGPPYVSPPPTPIPTLDTWAMILLATLLGGFGARRIRRL